MSFELVHQFPHPRYVRDGLAQTRDLRLENRTPQRHDSP
jgi:hypothetical protein